MGFRFRKSIKIIPGVRLNISRRGVSTSVGVPGATVNFSDRGTRGTVGIPGTGLSYSEQLGSANDAQERAQISLGWIIAVLAMAFVAWLVLA